MKSSDVGAVNARVRREKLSYDSVFENSLALHARFGHVFTCPNTVRLEQYRESIIQSIAPGADLLDYGCYRGDLVPWYASFSPRSISGIDISSTGIAHARANYGDIASFYEEDAHKTLFEDNSFDLVVGRAILHHLEFETAIHEVHRILKPNGTAIFVEPLADNPVAKLLRRLTKSARTVDEKPLSRLQIDYADRIFGCAEHYFANLCSVPLAMLTSQAGIAPDNFLLRFSDRIDRSFARTPLRYWMRVVLLVWKKMTDDTACTVVAMK